MTDWLNGITAIATVFMALFTGVLWWVTRGLLRTAVQQARLTQESIDLSRKEFIAAYPPEIIVRRISIHGNKEWPMAPITEAEKIQFIVTNDGRTPAHIVESNASIEWSQTDLPAIPPFKDAGNNCIGNITFLPGISSPFSIHLPIRSGNGDLYFFGYIVYKDDIGNFRRTAFCYRLSGERFIPINDPEYSYK